MLMLKVYSIFVIVMMLVGITNMEYEDKAAKVATVAILIPVLITLVYGGVC